jgi:plastocyanin
MKILTHIALFLASSLVINSALADWTVDFSRRAADMKKMDMEEMTTKNPLGQIFEKEQPKEEVVIANTDKGFIPSTVRLKKGQIYEISVVNVNKSKKNVSFMLDAFAEHHGTYFGDTVTFTVKPQKEGLFQFYSPEVEFIGKVLVYGSEDKLQPVPAIKIRQPAALEEAQDNVSNAVLRGGNE